MKTSVYQESADYILERIPEQPTVGIILGSGLGKLADSIEDRVVIPYESIPNFLMSTAPGHLGNLIWGRLGGKNVTLHAGPVPLLRRVRNGAGDLSYSRF